MGQKRRFNELDALRGVAALIIAFTWHYQHFTPLSNAPFYSAISGLYNYGYLAVELFFLISGFVMMHAYGQKIIKNDISFVDYMIRRLKHLYPLMFVTLIVVAAGQIYNLKTTGTFFVYGGTDLFHFTMNLLCIQTGFFDPFFSFNGPAWCMSVELVCYALLYFILRVSKGDSCKKYCYLAGTATVALAVVASQVNKPIINEQMARGVGSFFVGTICYAIYNYVKRIKKERGLSLISLAFEGVVIIVGISCREFNMFDNIKLLMVLGIVQALIFTCTNLKVVSKVLSIPPLVYLGKISLSVYMWHFPIQMLIDIANRNMGMILDYGSAKVWFLYIGIALVTAVLSYELFEKRFCGWLLGNRRKKGEAL